MYLEVINVNNDGSLEMPLAELAATPLEDLLAKAAPTLRAVLEQYAGEREGQPSNARFNAFIEP
jgi:hypothetical protein